MRVRSLGSILAAALVSGACGDDGATATGPLDPDTAAQVAVDRFSDTAATRFRRNDNPGLPDPDQPIDLDASPFLIDALGPDGQPIQLYDLDVRPRALVPVYELHRAGETTPVPEQLNIFDYIPGEHGYNDFWRVISVEVPADYIANTATDSAVFAARGYTVTPTTKIVNCPMVPAGTTARRRGGTSDGGLRRGWYHDQVVHYVTFEEAPLIAGPDGAPTAPMYVAYLVNPGQPGGGLLSGFRTEPGGSQTHNIATARPGAADYAPLRAVRVYDTAAFGSVHDRATAEAAPPIAAEPLLLNAPDVGPR